MDALVGKKWSGESREKELSGPGGLKSGRRERASAWAFSEPGRALMMKSKLEKKKDQRAWRRVSCFVVIK